MFGQQKPAVRIQVDPAKVGRPRPVARGRAHRHRRTNTVGDPKGAIQGRRRTFTIYGNDQILSAGSVERRHRRLSRTAAPVRVRDIGTAIDAPENYAARRVGQRQAGDPAAGVQAARRQRHRDGRQDQGAAATVAGEQAPAALQIELLSDRTTTIRASVADVENDAAHHRAWWSR